jgi:hypothetical protein
MQNATYLLRYIKKHGTKIVKSYIRIALAINQDHEILVMRV